MTTSCLTALRLFSGSQKGAIPAPRESARKLSRFVLVSVVLLLALPVIATAKNTPANIDTLSHILPDSLQVSGKIVYVDFWASWCSPCRFSIPFMKSLQEKYATDSFVVVGINVDHDHSAAETFIEKWKPGFSILFDSSGSLAELYDLKALPSSFIYDRSGHLVKEHIGFQQEDTAKIDLFIKELLTEEHIK